MAGWPTAHSHQPPGKDQPSAGSQRAKSSTHKFNFALGSCTVLAASISDLNTRVKSARCPFDRTHFYCRAVSIRCKPMQIPWCKDPATGVRGDRGTSRVSRSTSRAHSHIHDATEQLVRKSRFNIGSNSDYKMTRLPVRNLHAALRIAQVDSASRDLKPPLVVLFSCVRAGLTTR